MNVELPRCVRFGREVCGDLAQAERREWWLANGLGGYAGGTIAGTLTRRYHGLLIAPIKPPLGRYLVFAKADATLIDGQQAFQLFSNRWGGDAVDPRGYINLESFRLDGRMPVWRYVFGDIAIESRIWLEHGANTVYVAYRLMRSPHAARKLRLRVKLLVNARDHHSSATVDSFDAVVDMQGQRLYVHHPRLFDMHLDAHGGAIAPDRTWYGNFDLALERERGLPTDDAHLCVGEADLELAEDQWCGVVASLHEDATTHLEDAMRRFLARETQLLRGARARTPQLARAPDWIDQLVLSADSFVFARPSRHVPDGESVIAGYPWFGDWGRDTMIALPGLTLATGRYESAWLILLTFARFVDRGMLPNVFPGDGETPEYNTADAALWYFEAWRAYFDCVDDQPSLALVLPVLEEIVDWHVRGTRFGIRVDPADGLLFAGEPGTQVTWMDAKVGEWVVTPRIGKPVEINALWYNALVTAADFAARLGRDAGRYRALADRARAGFARFRKPMGGLFDVIDGPDGTDATMRPNQIFAVSLPHSPLERADQLAVVEQCGRELLASYGLRSLAPDHPDFKPRYEGGVSERDGAYHQGPVWAWLLGHYALAVHRVTGDAAMAQSCLRPIRDHLNDAGLGTVSEIFDGAAPHLPRGCPAQAWSVACILEAWSRLEGLGARENK
jgi:predicted glycogen debranching enzyme